MSDAGITEKDAVSIAKNTNLRVLFICGNHLGNKGASSLAQHPALVELNLLENDISKLDVSFGDNKTLRKLTVCKNKLDSDGVHDLFQNTTLEILSLGYNELDDNCIEGLMSMKSLKELDVAHNKLSNKAALIILQRSQSQDSVLEDITIADNPVYNEGFYIDFKKITSARKRKGADLELESSQSITKQPKA